MVCRQFKMGDVTVWECSRGPAPRCDVCGKKATCVCDFPFAGSRKGETCDKPLCSKCATVIDGGDLPDGFDHEGELDLCPAHLRFAKRSK